MFTHDFLVIFKYSLQNYWKLLKKCFLNTTDIVIYLLYSNINEKKTPGHKRAKSNLSSLRY